MNIRAGQKNGSSYRKEIYGLKKLVDLVLKLTIDMNLVPTWFCRRLKVSFVSAWSEKVTPAFLYAAKRFYYDGNVARQRRVARVEIRCGPALTSHHHGWSSLRRTMMAYASKGRHVSCWFGRCVNDVVPAPSWPQPYPLSAWASLTLRVHPVALRHLF